MSEAIIKQVQAALERQARINIHKYPIVVRVAEGAVVLEGEVADIAAKKLAMELAAAQPGIRGVVDRLRVAPAERRGDGAIRDSLGRLLLAEPELRRCSLRVRTNERSETLREVDQDAIGVIEFSVGDGVIVLEGHVISLPHRLFAGALAWWTSGRRDVINAIEVKPAYEERDDEVAEALRIVLEADPLVQADQIRSNCARRVITLDGSVPNEEQRRRAELDAWALSGIDRVVNRLSVTG